MKLDEVKLDNKITIPVDRHNGKSYSIAKYVESVLNPRVYCKFCGRLLKNAKSKQNGFGQGCYERWVKSRSNKRSLV